MVNHRFSLLKLKEIDIVEYLENLGYQPQSIHNNDYWYLSPLREEKHPSFKVNRKLNLWYDHGLGEGGSIIDFGMLYYKCSIPTFIPSYPSLFLFIVTTSRFNSLKQTRKSLTRHLNLR